MILNIRLYAHLNATKVNRNGSTEKNILYIMVDSKDPARVSWFCGNKVSIERLQFRGTKYYSLVQIEMDKFKWLIQRCKALSGIKLLTGSYILDAFSITDYRDTGDIRNDFDVKLIGVKNLNRETASTMVGMLTIIKQDFEIDFETEQIFKCLDLYNPKKL